MKRVVVMACIVGTMLLLPGWASSGTAGTGRPNCHGEPATQVGTPGDDRIVVTKNNAVVKARGGNDKIEVYGDSATVCGGKGGDGIGAFPRAGGHGRFFGNRGRDCLGKAECTKDRTNTIGFCRHYSVTVELDGGPSPDYMWGGNRGDILRGSRGDDDEYGCWGDDRAIGGGGDDYLYGRKGDDHLKGGVGDADLARGGTGLDYCRAETKRGCER
jgi:hypothetical protein